MGFLKGLGKAALPCVLAAGLNGCLTPLMKAAQRGDLRATQTLIDQGADINAVNDGIDRWSALHVAAWKGQVETVRLLIRHGADLSARTGQGWTALDVARKFHHPEVEAAILAESHGSAPGSAEPEPEAQEGRLGSGRAKKMGGRLDSAAPEPESALSPVPTAETPAALVPAPVAAPEPKAEPRPLNAEQVRDFDGQLLP